MKADIEAGVAEVSERTGLLAKSLRDGVSLGTDKLATAASEGLHLATVLTPRALMDAASDDHCVITYDPVDLTSWKSLTMLQGSIFAQRSLWFVIVVTLLLTAIVAVLFAFFARQPESYDTAVIRSVIQVVTIAMAFLLGLFVNNALQRWWDIVKTFERLFGASKRLIAALVNFDVKNEVRENTARLCVLSVLMLRYEKVVGMEAIDVKEAWAKKLDSMVETGEMTPGELELMQQVPEQARSTVCWNLLAKDLKGCVEPHRFKLIYMTVEEGASAVSRIKTTGNFHFPFLYVHMLAWMVHLVNFLTALGAGISIGLLIARKRLCTEKCEPLDGGRIMKELLFLFLQVFLYQAFLSIGAALSFPIVPKGHGAMYRLPLAEMIEGLKSHLQLVNRLADEKRI